MMEQEEWMPLNRELRHHGFPLVELLDPSIAHDVSDLVLMTSESARTLRQTLLTLMKDCDRRQELVQELIVTNNQIREELKSQTVVSEKYEVKARDLKSMLEDSRLKLQEVEDEHFDVSSLSRDEGERLRNTKDAAAVRCDQLSHKCSLYQTEIERLQKKLKHINTEEEHRKKKQTEVLKQLRQKWAKGSTTNESMLNVIDYYESQLSELRSELPVDGDVTADSHHDNMSRTSLLTTNTDGATGNYKALIKSYERQLRDAKKKMKTLENETELMKLEIQSRPALSDYRESQARLKKLERILKHHGICPAHNSEKKAKMLFSTKVEDVEFLPVSQCRQYLKMSSVELGVDDVEMMVPRISQLTQSSVVLPQLQQFSQAVVEVVNSSSEPHKRTPHAAWCEKNTRHVIPTLQHWAVQIQANQELQQSIHRLSSALFPWKQLEHMDHPTTVDMIQLMDSLLDDAEHVDVDKKQQHKPQCGMERPSQKMLEEIVSHFQNLFEVRSISGVYAQMNEVYTRLGEMRNVMNSLKDLLALDRGCKTSVVVDVVARLLDSRHSVTVEHIHSVLHTDDLDSVAVKLKEHDEFFTVFHELLQSLMEALNVRRLDQVVPAVRALKLLAGS